MSRGNRILAGVLIVQVAIAVAVLWPRSATVAGGEPLYAGVEVDQIVRVTITDLVEGQLELAKAQGNWVLPGAGGYPCRADAVPDLLEKLVALRADRLVTETQSSHKRLKVDEQDYARKIEFVLADDTLHTLYVGTSPSYGVAHVRVKGQDHVYLAAGLSSSDAAVRASSWIDTLYLSLEQDQVTAVVLENANGSFEFGVDEAGTWTMSGLAADETLQTSAVTSLVSRISSLRMLEPLGTDEQRDYGLASPAATITVRAGDQTYVLSVGAQRAGDNAYVIKSSASPYYVWVAEYTVGEYVGKTRDEFLELPPTPTP